ncbi:cation transporter [Anaerotignum sp.]
MIDGIIIFIIVVLAVISIKKYKSNMKYGCCGSGNSGTGRRVEVADKDPANYPYHAVLSIKGMSCENCVRYVENALNEQEGIWAQADLKMNAAFVRMKKPYTEEEFSRILHRAGYTVTEVKDRNPSE